MSEKVRANDIIGGEINPITRQAEGGRKNNGGVKVAEMERWCIVGHGAAHTVNEMYRQLSDGAVAHVEMSSGERNGHLRANPMNASPTSRLMDTNYSVLSVRSLRDRPYHAEASSRYMGWFLRDAVWMGGRTRWRTRSMPR